MRLLALTLFLFTTITFANPEVTIPPASGIRSDLLKNIAPIIQKSIAANNYPGAVVLIAHRGQIIYQGVFGNRRTTPNRAPMQLNTIFDIASLTKVIATTPAIMQLVEQGKLDLDTPVAKYWPAFAKHGKEKITIRELLTHTSGLQADIDYKENQTRRWIQDTAESNAIKNLTPIHTPGTQFLYSDLNFVILAQLVEMISHEHFDQYVKNHIFKPLHMNDTFFLPSEKLRDRIAPTEIMDKKLRWGVVHDPLAHAMGGVSGHAGLFSDAADLGIFAQCLLDNGRISSDNISKNILGPLTILKMTTPQTPAAISETRGLGWDIDSRYSNRGVLFPTRSFGHTGWTGTSIWIDPTSQTWMIILTSRTHPKPAHHNQLIQDRRIIANIVAASITDIKIEKINNTQTAELKRAFPALI